MFPLHVRTRIYSVKTLVPLPQRLIGCESKTLVYLLLQIGQVVEAGEGDWLNAWG